MNQTYLICSNKYPYQSYVVGSKEYCEKQIKCKKYQRGFHIRKAIDDSDGCYRIVYEGGLRATIGYISFKKALNECYQQGERIQFIGTERDWLVMQNQDVCIQDSIRGFGRDISQEWSKELYKETL